MLDTLTLWRQLGEFCIMLSRLTFRLVSFSAGFNPPHCSKPHGSEVHFSVTTSEPHGTCCIQGLKISMGMHNFGETRWGAGLLDDFRSQSDRNTRIVGDFTKMIRTAPVTEKMLEYMTNEKDKNWQVHFAQVAVDSGFSALNEFDPIVPKIQKACLELAQVAPSFRRQTVQTRFFETGDNYYLGK